MDITSLTVVLSAVAVIAATVLVVSNEPPLWVCLLSCVGSLPLSGVLLDAPAVTSALGEGSAATWGLRLAVAASVTVVLSFFFGADGREKHRYAADRTAPGGAEQVLRTGDTTAVTLPRGGPAVLASEPCEYWSPAVPGSSGPMSSRR
ncbi:hypothetical protein [Streptomyces hokutonensis]|uniref:hypothetical protein n=1 Tax=Streptomyces hokutonensis TaxID=1306990 RepID=UPI0036798A8F